MSTHGETRNERRKAAAWAWYERGASGSCTQPSGALLLKRRRRRNSFNHEDDLTAAARVGGISRRPSRFKREAAAAHYDQHLQATLPSPAEAHDQDVFAAAAAALTLRLKYDQHNDHCHNAAAGPSITHHPLQKSSTDDLASCFCSVQSTTAACRICLPSQGQHRQPAALELCAGYCDSISLQPRRKSASSPPAYCSHLSDKLFGVSSRKSFSSPQSSAADSLGKFCSPDHERLDALLSLGDEAEYGEGAAAAAAFYSPDSSRSSLLDSFELCAVLKKLGYKIEPCDLEQALSSSERPETTAVGNNEHAFSSPPLHCKQSLYDLLGWSERGLDMKGGRCCTNHEEDNFSTDHFYNVESPEINIPSCSNCDAKAAAQNIRQQRRRRRQFSESFSNVLHHIHLPTSFSNALHQLPHSFSNTLHHLPQLPHSFSNALAHFTHSLSSAYQNLHVGSHRHNTDEGVAPHPHINNTPPSAHNSHSKSASPDHHAHTHQNLLPSSLRHFLSFKWHHSPLHPSCEPALNGVSLVAKYCSNHTRTLAEHHLKSSPPFDLQGLSKSDDYMLIYSSVKKHSDYGISGHHHYHHHHYIF